MNAIFFSVLSSLSSAFSTFSSILLACRVLRIRVVDVDNGTVRAIVTSCCGDLGSDDGSCDRLSLIFFVPTKDLTPCGRNTRTRNRGNRAMVRISLLMVGDSLNIRCGLSGSQFVCLIL